MARKIQILDFSRWDLQWNVGKEWSFLNSTFTMHPAGNAKLKLGVLSLWMTLPAATDSSVKFPASSSAVTPTTTIAGSTKVFQKSWKNYVFSWRLPQDSGKTCMHQQWHTRYFYDKVSNICRPFNYSGCEGNSNNFDSLYACQHTCTTTSGGGLPHNSQASRQPNDLIEKCQMPRDQGKCHLGNLHHPPVKPQCLKSTKECLVVFIYLVSIFEDFQCLSIFRTIFVFRGIFGCFSCNSFWS